MNNPACRSKCDPQCSWDSEHQGVNNCIALSIVMEKLISPNSQNCQNCHQDKLSVGEKYVVTGSPGNVDMVGNGFR